MLPCPTPPAEILKIFRAEAPAGPQGLGSACQRPMAVPGINTLDAGEWEDLRVPGESPGTWGGNGAHSGSGFPNRHSHTAVLKCTSCTSALPPPPNIALPCFPHLGTIQGLLLETKALALGPGQKYNAMMLDILKVIHQIKSITYLLR